MIKNIIFDIADVLLKFNRDYLISLYYNGAKKEILKEKLFDGWEELDDDKISLADYQNKVINSLPTDLKPIANAILNNWEYSMSYHDGIVDLVYELKQKGYKLYILSNMTYHFINNDYKFPLFKEFDGILYSADVKVQKPDPEIFRILLEKFNINPTESLFIDDRKPNLDCASKFGLKTFLFKANCSKLREFILAL